VDNFCWPDPVGSPEKAGWLVRACYGLRDACLALSAPLISGKDSMKNDFRGRQGGREVLISVVPTLLVTAVGRVRDVKQARTADFKSPGDVVYLLGGTQFGLRGSELQSVAVSKGISELRGLAEASVGIPDWITARKTYCWLGGAEGKLQSKLRSLHDVSEGGLLVAVAESLFSRSSGVALEFSTDLLARSGLWELAFGEGFHGFVASVGEADVPNIEREWGELGVPFTRIGIVTNEPRLQLRWEDRSGPWRSFTAAIPALRAAWSKEGYWE
jgi:phosphoribosylformylglycinamidine synthase subunit PurSL